MNSLRASEHCKKADRSLVFASATFYAGMTDGQAAWMASAIRKMFDPRFGKHARIGRRLREVHRRDQQEVERRTRAAHGFALDGGSGTKEVMIGCREVPGNTWFDFFRIENSETCNSLVINSVVKKVLAKYPNLRFMVMDKATYNVKGVSGLPVLVVFCLGHCFHNVVKTFIKDNFRKLHVVLMFCKNMMFNAPTREGRYLAFQKKTAEKEQVGHDSDVLEALLALRESFDLFSQSEVEDGLAEVWTRYADVLRGVDKPEPTQSHIGSVIGELRLAGQGSAGKPEPPAAMVSSGGTRWTSQFRLLSHLCLKRHSIVGFVQQESERFGSTTCESVKGLLRIFSPGVDATVEARKAANDRRDAVWNEAAQAKEILEPIAHFIDEVADLTRKKSVVEMLHSRVTGVLAKVKEKCPELASSLQQAYEADHAAIYTAARLLHPAVARLKKGNVDSSVEMLLSAFPTIFDESSATEYRTWVTDTDVSTAVSGSCFSFWKNSDEAYPALKKSALTITSITPVVTGVDSGFSNMELILSNKRRKRLTTQSLGMRTQLFINKDITNVVGSDDVDELDWASDGEADCDDSDTD